MFTGGRREGDASKRYYRTSNWRTNVALRNFSRPGALSVNDLTDCLTKRALFRRRSPGRERAVEVRSAFVSSTSPESPSRTAGKRKPETRRGSAQRRAAATTGPIARFESTLTRFMIGLNFKRKRLSRTRLSGPAHIGAFLFGMCPTTRVNPCASGDPERRRALPSRLLSRRSLSRFSLADDQERKRKRIIAKYCAYVLRTLRRADYDSEQLRCRENGQ